MRMAMAATLLAMAAAAAPARADGDALAGEWRIEQIAGVDAFDAAKTSFELLPNGRMASTVGCNRMIGEPKIHGDRIAFGAVAATRMACPPPLDELERKYSAALESARTYRVEGAKLVLADSKGAPVVVFRRPD
jgi:heat shock protein HslJ